MFASVSDLLRIERERDELEILNLQCVLDVVNLRHLIIKLTQGLTSSPSLLLMHVISVCFIENFPPEKM